VKPRFFATPEAFRKWLEAHHDKESELLVGFYKVGSGKKSITWPESVDEALCFGWIDGVRKRIDDVSYTIRFTPRKAKSYWSAVNTKRYAALEKLGRITGAGRAAFEARDATATARYSFEREAVELGEELEARFRANKKAWEYFQAQPPHYRRTSIWYVVSAKREETRARRLEKLIDHSAKGAWLPEFISAKPERTNRGR
jgi:uncharacterized protein YdeI (YjbR/CyaY-like superfamily)